MERRNETVVRYERPRPVHRFRDFLVVLAFSLAALGAAFAFVQLRYTDGSAERSSDASIQPSASAMPREGESAPEPVPENTQSTPPQAAPGEARALAEMRSELDRVQGDLQAAIARIGELEAVVLELQAAAARGAREEPDPQAGQESEKTVDPEAAPAAEPTRAVTGKKQPVQLDGENIPASQEQTEYVVQSGDTLARIADIHCLALSDLLRLNADLRDPNALRVGQSLSVEDRCVAKSNSRAAAD